MRACVHPCLRASVSEGSGGRVGERGGDAVEGERERGIGRETNPMSQKFQLVS